MAIAKKDRFEKKGIKVDLKMPATNFPPEKVIFEGKKLINLGKSNKEDLFPASIEDTDLMKASVEGNVGQYIYSSDSGDLYDLLLYIDEFDSIVLHGIRTRLL